MSLEKLYYYQATRGIYSTQNKILNETIITQNHKSIAYKHCIHKKIAFLQLIND